MSKSKNDVPILGFNHITKPYPLTAISSSTPMSKVKIIVDGDQSSGAAAISSAAPDISKSASAVDDVALRIKRRTMQRLILCQAAVRQPDAASDASSSSSSVCLSLANRLFILLGPSWAGSDGRWNGPGWRNENRIIHQVYRPLELNTAKARPYIERESVISEFITRY